MNIYEVAEKAGVSATTVSRVINKSGLVSEKTKKRVLQVIDELGYRPNVFAKGLTTNSMQTIGILTTNICDLYFATAIQEIVRFAREKNYDVILSHTEEAYEEKKKSLQMLMDKRVDGIILIGSVFKEMKDNSYIISAAQAVPIITLNSQIIGKNVYSVYCDDATGAYLAADHLIRQGRSRIAFVHDVDTFSARNKLEGYYRAMREHEMEPLCKKCQSHVEGGMAAARELLTSPVLPDGIICSEDELAAGVLNVLNEKGIKVPEDIAVTGYNNLTIPKCTNPQLATVDGKVKLLAEYAFDCIHRVLNTGSGPNTIVITPEIIPGRSADAMK